jgi:hypothetical protein
MPTIAPSISPPPPSQLTATLSPTIPESTLAIAPGMRLSVVEVTVRERSNPQGQAFSVAVSIVTGTGAREELGSAAPFPLGQPVTVSFGVSPGTTSAAAEFGATLIVRLRAVSSDRPLVEPLSVEVIAVHSG